jgi:hypothetical protein
LIVVVLIGVSVGVGVVVEIIVVVVRVNRIASPIWIIHGLSCEVSHSNEVANCKADAESDKGKEGAVAYACKFIEGAL